MTTQPTDGGPETSVTERRLGANPVVSSLLFPEHVCAAAFLEAEDRMCCPRQIAAVTGLDFERVCEGLDDAEMALDGTALWRELGCTAKMIFQYARVRGLGACLLHSEQVVETLAGSRPLTFAIVANHAYFYDSPRVARALSKRRPHDFEALKRDIQATGTPDASEWLPLDLSAGIPEAGHYAVGEEDIDATREYFLRSGRHPRVTLKDATTIKGMRYTFVRGKDPGRKGSVHIHTLPQHAREIQEWLARLDIGLPYRGEGLPGMAYKVLLKLLNRGASASG
jgi:hypothetical protein